MKGKEWKLRWDNMPFLLIPQILQVKIHYNADVPDEAIWKLTENGNFTIASAWEFIRKKKSESGGYLYLE